MHKALICLLGSCLFALSLTAHADTGVTCHTISGGTVTVGDQTYPQEDLVECEFWDDGMGDGGGGGGGGSGGGGSSAGVWVTVPGDGAQLEINLTKNQVRALHLTCADEEILIARAAQAIVIKNPNLSASTVVTVFVADGSQEFRRVSSSGSVQMGPVSQCH